MQMHRMQHYIPYADTDQMGVVYHANYLIYFEMARTSMLRACGLPYRELEKRGVMLPVTEAHVSYRSPARFEDCITVEVRCAGFVKMRMRIDYTITLADTVLVEGYTEHVCMTVSGRPIRPDAELKALFTGETA